MKDHPWHDTNFRHHQPTGTRTTGARSAIELGHALPWDGVEERESPEDSSSRRTEGGRVEWSTEIDDEPAPLRPLGAVCPRCFIELPATGVCGYC